MPYDGCVEPPLGVAEHPDLLAEYIFQPVLAHAYFPGNFLGGQWRQNVVGHAMTTHLEAFQRQRPQLGRLKGAASVMANERRIEGPWKTSGAQ